MPIPFAELGEIVIAAFGEVNAIDVTRYPAGGVYVDGIWTPGVPTVIPMDAAVLVPTARQIQQLPEGERTADSRAIYTVASLLAPAPGQEADRVTWDGAIWRVAKDLTDWTVQAGYALAMVLREGQG